MLKVVGASIAQTRVASYILAALAIVGIFVIIFGGNFGRGDENDGIYSATVYWKNKIGYRIEFWGQGNNLEEIPKGSARAYYKPDLYVNGWSKLEIETNPVDPDWVQAYSAGLLEGSLTWQLIYWHWQNTIQSICETQEEQCEELREYIRKNSDSIRTKAIQLSDVDPYWHQIRLYFAQLDGMETGWNYAVKRSRQSYEIPTEDFFWMNIDNDVNDLAYKFGLVFEDLLKEPNLSSAFFKLTNVSTDTAVHVAHNTAGMYRKMLRIIKRYIFNFHYTGAIGSDVISGTIITFTGYPGVISSQDDFYLIKSQHDPEHSLTVTGTPISTVNISLWDEFNPTEMIFTSARVMAANRLAIDGHRWTHYFALRNSGTDNKQWVLFDLKKLSEQADQNLIWVIEQIPGLIKVSDLTNKFYQNGYWASFGIPFFKEIQESIELVNLTYAAQFGDSNIRAELFEDCGNNCITLDNILYNLRHGISPEKDRFGARGDLYPENPVPYGMIDSKIFTGTSKKIFDFQVLSGPVYRSDSETAKSDEEKLDSIAPFQWSSSKFNDISHIGQPDVWKFQPFHPTWVWI